MPEEFFQQLTDCLRREAQRRPGFAVSEETRQALFQNQARPAAAPSHPPAREPIPVPERRSAPPVQPHAAAIATPFSPPAPAAEVATLEELNALAQACHACPLAPTRGSVVFGEGNPEAKLMFIGEGPGHDEDQQGRPFVGPAGQLLTKMIEAMQFSRAEVYIANVVKCRPPRNRNPEPDEAAACRPFLVRQIELIRPEVIVVLGAVAVRYLLNRQEGISRLRGKWLGFNGIPVMPTFHPSFLLREPAAKRDAWSDLQQVMKVFGKVPGGK